MSADSLEILSQLRKLRDDYEYEKSKNKMEADEAVEQINKLEQLNLLNYKDKTKCNQFIEEYRKKKEIADECIDEYESYISKYTTLIERVQNKHAGIFKDIDILEAFIQKGQPQTECPKIRSIKNRLLLTIEKYRRILEVCND